MAKLTGLRIGTKLSLITLMGFLTVALVGWYVLAAEEDSLEQANGTRMVDLAMVMLNQIGQGVAARMNDLERVGNWPEIRAALARANGTVADSSVEAPGWLRIDNAASAVLEREFVTLSRRVAGYSAFTDLVLTDRQGRVVAAVGRPGGRDMIGEVWWQRTRTAGRFVGGLVHDPLDDSYGFLVAVRIEDRDGRFLGIIKARLSPRWVSREAAAAADLPLAGEIWLTTGDGRLIFASRPFNFLDNVSARPFYRMATGNRGHHVVESGDRDWLFAHANYPAAPAIGGLGWRLFVGVPLDRILADVYRLQNRLFLVFAALLVVGLVLSILMARDLARPLAVLEQAARKFARGEAWPALPVDRRDEIGVLAATFDDMAQAIADKEAELATHARALEEYAEDLERFAYAASHDLRAPLQAISHVSHWLDEDLAGKVDADARENLALLRGRVQRLEHMLDEIIGYYAVGQPGHRVGEVAVGSLLSEIAVEAGLPPGFTIDWPGDLPVIRADPQRLGKVFKVLIENAHVHHDRPAGTIRIDARRREHGWEFRVQDDGPGIPVRYHQRVFELFRTLQPRDQVEGSGVGLALVRRIVSREGGRVWVESAPPDRGTSLCFFWPDECYDTRNHPTGGSAPDRTGETDGTA